MGNREGVLDGKNPELIAEKAKKQAHQDMKLPSYNADVLASKLREKCTSNGNFDWGMLGREVGVCFNAAPLVSFFNGPMNSEYVVKVRQQRKQRSRQVDEEEEEELDKHEKSSGKKLSVVERNLSEVQTTLKQKYKAHLNNVKSRLASNT